MGEGNQGFSSEEKEGVTTTKKMRGVTTTENMRRKEGGLSRKR